jgi:RNA recognition motif-containing protein
MISPLRLTIYHITVYRPGESRHRGFGYVTFETQEQASACRERMTGQALYVDGPQVRVDYATSPAASNRPVHADPTRFVYVGGLGPDTRRDDLIRVFGAAPGFESARISESIFYLASSGSNSHGYTFLQEPTWKLANAEDSHTSISTPLRTHKPQSNNMTANQRII